MECYYWDYWCNDGCVSLYTMMPSFPILSFVLFSVTALVAAVLVICTDNPIYSALFLIVVFLSTSILILLLDVEFLAIIFVLIYIGAIMVLVLFIIMMLDIQQVTTYVIKPYYFFVSGLVLILLVGEFYYFLSKDVPMFQRPVLSACVQ